MALWGIDKPPVWAPDAVATPAGWRDGKTNELLVTIVGLSTTKGGAANLVDVRLASTVATHEKNSILVKKKFKLGDTFDIEVVFNEAVVVNTGGGTPRITFKIGASNTSASYVSGSGTNILVFRYTVLSTHTGAPNTVTSPIQLQSGTIKDKDNASQNSPLVFTFNAGHTALLPNITLDGVVPTISGVTCNAGPFVTGNIIELTATFSEAVTVTGATKIALTIHSQTRQAVYATGSGTTALKLRYTVIADDGATAGQFSTATAIVLNGGTITDAVGNATTPLTFSAPDTSAVTVN